MRIKKLLALALTGITVLSSVPVSASTTNKIGYTQFLFPEDGKNFYLNAEHKFLGNFPYSKYISGKLEREEGLTQIQNQEIILPINTYISFDVTNLSYDYYKYEDYIPDEYYVNGSVADVDFEVHYADVEENYGHNENQKLKAVRELKQHYLGNFAYKYDAGQYYATYGDSGETKPSKATITFTQDGKQLAKLTINPYKLADNKNFMFYNKSKSPVKVTLETDTWCAVDLGYTAHKPQGSNLKLGEWTFSTQPSKTYTTQIKNKEWEYVNGSTWETKINQMNGAISYLSVDGKPAHIKAWQNGKLVMDRKVKSNTTVQTKVLKRGKYTIKVTTKSKGYNIMTNDDNSISNIKLNKSMLYSGYDLPYFTFFIYKPKSKSFFYNTVTTKDYVSYNYIKDNYDHIKHTYSYYLDGDIYYTIFIEGTDLYDLNFAQMKY